MSFESFQFNSLISSNIRSVGYEAPTPIQEQAIPHVLAGRDVLGLAQTGTGKTAAFMLPILQRLMAAPAGRTRKIRALVVAPTRELAEQIDASTKDYAKGSPIRSATIYGGVSQRPQVEALKRGLDIVTACPGRLLDHIGQGNVDLSALEVLVLDEADHMFDMGFLPDIRRILRFVPERRQTLLFSATMPGEIEGLTREVLRDPVTVRVGRSAPASTLSHALYPVPEKQKTPLLLEILRQTEAGSVLVFTRTKHRAKRLALQLERAGHAAASLQGNLSQNRRQAAMDGFRSGTYRILVATDIAARGIDVTRVARVINYDVPDTADAYTHRVGRAGRAERTGDALTLVTSEDAQMIRAIERVLGETLPRTTLEGFVYGADEPATDNEDSRRDGRPGNRRGGRGMGGERPAAAAAPRGPRPEGARDGRPARQQQGQRKDQKAVQAQGQSAQRPAQPGQRQAQKPVQDQARAAAPKQAERSAERQAERQARQPAGQKAQPKAPRPQQPTREQGRAQQQPQHAKNPARNQAPKAEPRPAAPQGREVEEFEDMATAKRSSGGSWLPDTLRGRHQR